MVRQSKSAVEKAVSDLKETESDGERTMAPFAASEELIDLWMEQSDLEKPENEWLIEAKEILEQTESNKVGFEWVTNDRRDRSGQS